MKRGKIVLLIVVWWLGTIVAQPTLIPYTPDPTNDFTPTLEWSSVSGATDYRIQIDDEAGFSSLIYDGYTSGATNYTHGDSLPEDTIYWHVSSDTGLSPYTDYSVTDNFVITGAPIITPYAPDPTPDKTPTFYWNSVSGAADYQIQVAEDISFATKIVDNYTSGAVSYTVSGPVLSPMTYYWRVSANLDYNKYFGYDEFDFQQPIFNPFPEDTTIDQTPTLTWNNYPGATTYKIEIDENVAFSSPLVDFVSNSTSYTPMSNLSQGTTYWHFSTDHDYTSFSDIDSFVIDINQYPEPIPFSPETVTTLQPLFQWNPVSGASNYTLHVDDDPAFGSLDINTNIGATSYSSPTDMAQGTFYWKLSSSLKPNSYCPYEIVTICTAPHINEYTPDPTPKFNPTLTWGPVSDATGYKIEIDDNASFTTPMTDYISGATSYPASLPSEKTWYWHVSSNIDTTYYSNTDDFSYQKPQLNRWDGAAINDTFPDFIWSSYPGGGVSSYKIEVDYDIGFVSAGYSDFVSGGTSYTSPWDLSAATTWYWRVSTDLDYGAYSDIDSVRITQGPQLVTYGGDSTMDLQPTFRWHPVSGASSYTLQVDNNIDFSTCSQNSPNDTFSLSPSELSLGMHYWRVSSNLNVSDFSDPDSIKIVDTVSCWHVSTTGDSTNSGTAAFPLDSISHAMGHAGPGDTIKVAQGTYSLNSGFNIEECGIMLLGGYSDNFAVRNSDSLVTSIDAQNTGNCITIFTDSDTVGIDGITFKNSSMYFIYVMYGDYLSVANCRFVNCYKGIEFHEGNYGKIENTIFAFDSIGVAIDNSKGTEVKNNTFFRNGIGVKNSYYSDSVVVTNNIFAYNVRGYRRYSDSYQYADSVRYNCFYTNDSDYVDSANTLYTGTAMNSDPHNNNNIAQDPVFKDTAYATYDFHLSLGSQCVDAGDGSPYTNEPAPNGSIINLGAYGNTQWACISGTAPSITTHPASDTSEVGGSQTFSASATGTAPLTYQWYKNGTPIAAATVAVFNINPVSLSDSGNYSVMVSNTYGSVSSLTAKLFVPIPLTITSQPTDSTVAIDDPVRLSVVAAGHEPLFYLWIKEGTDTVGYASNFDKDPAVVSDSGNYNCVVYNEFDTVTSTIAKITVTVEPIVITVQPSDTTVDIDSAVSLSVSTTGYGTLSYRWIKEGTDTVGISAVYSIPSAAMSDTGSYSCAVFNAYDTVTSTTAKIFVTVTPIVITTQPKDTTVLLNDPVGFSVTATGYLPFNYAWIRNGTDSVGTNNGYSKGAAQVSDTGKYHCMVYNPYDTVSSDTVRMSVEVPPVANFSSSQVSGIDTMTVTFYDSSKGDVDRWIWNYGDGTIDSFTVKTDPVHMYTAPGIYSVTLNAHNNPFNLDSTLTKVNLITVYQKSVSTFTGSPQTGIDTLTVQFDLDSISTGVSEWIWTYGDGDSETFYTATNPSHFYTAPGTFGVKLKVSGTGGVDSTVRAGYIDVYTGVNASFSSSDSVGIALFTINFFDSSTGDISTRTWDFGDIATDTGKTPTHTYTTPGVYSVKLVVSGFGGTDSIVKQNHITIYEPVVAKFYAQDTTGVAPCAVQFYDSSTGDISAWLWSFGDGNTDTAKTPMHTYSAPGTYTVSLTVTGPGGIDSIFKSDFITVYQQAAASFVVSDSVGIAPFAVSFYDSSTGDIDTWDWEFGDGSSDTSQHATHVYTAKGVYSPKLVVSGPGGIDSVVLTDKIIVYEPVVAKFSVSDTDGVVPLQVQFFDSSTGDIDSWLWGFGDGNTDTTKTPVHTYTASGTYTVSLTVSGNGGVDSLVKTDCIKVYESAVAKFSASDTIGESPLIVTFNDSSSGDIDTWYWEFGDGNTGSVQTPVHEYTTRGIFDVKLVVSGNGGSDSLAKSEYITVLNSPPVLTLPLVDTLFEDSVQTITATVTDVNNDTVTLSFLGNVPPDMTIDQATHTITWTPDNEDVGEYSIVVMADDNYGGTDTAALSLIVLNTNDYPVIDSIMFPDTAYEDSLMIAKVVVSDPDILDSVGLSLSSNVTWLSITRQPLTRGGSWKFDIKGTPGDADTGLFQITVAATDRDSLSTDTVQIVFVVNTNDPPDTKLSKKDVLYGAVRYAVTAADDFDSIFTFNTQFNGGGIRYDTTISNTSGTFSFYPLADGRYIFSCKAEDQDGLEDPTPYIDTIVISGASAHTWSDTGIWDMLSVPIASYSAAAIKTAGKILHWDESQEPNGIYKYYIRSSGITDLTAGKAYWIELDTIAAVSLAQNELSTADSLVIKLSKAEYGWNQIASPYPYPVKWNSTLTLWEWDATNRDFVESDGVLYPWDGYWVLAESATPVTVKADPLYVSKSHSRRSRTLFVDKTEWTFKITLKSNINHDADNLFGVSKYARNGYDALDRPEPPRMGDEPYLFFAHPEWKRSVNQFASDIRRTWDSKVNIFQLGISPCAKDVTALMFTISGYNEDTPIYLFVNTLPEVKQYKPGTAVTIKPSDAVQYRTVFATTDKDFLSKFPYKFALNHPYPNPCRSRATIRYTLPYRWESNGWLNTNPYKVTMVIYDARGRVIRELVNRKQGPGHYRIIWRGKSNTGHMVASGFYFIRIVAGKYSSVKKIITLR